MFETIRETFPCQNSRAIINESIRTTKLAADTNSRVRFRTYFHSCCI